MVYPEINLQSGVPLYQQLKRSFQRMAALGIIKAHEQLPLSGNWQQSLELTPTPSKKPTVNSNRKA